MSEILRERLFILLRSAIYARSVEEFSVFNGMDDEQWSQLMTIAKRHGLMLLTAEALEYLPSQYHPSLKLKATWAFALINAEGRFEHYKKTVEQLAEVMSDGGLPMILIKGLTVASLYPNPTRREGGDIDMFLLGDKNKGDELIKSLGIAVYEEGDDEKHSHFVFNGVDVENHNTFIDIEHYVDKYWQRTKRINEIIHNAVDEGRLSEMTIGSQRVATLEPTVALFFMVAHAMMHAIGVDGAIRQYSDIVVYTNHYREQIDSEWLKSRFEECGMSKYVANMEHFCVTRLGMSPLFDLDEKYIVEGELSLENILFMFRVKAKSKSIVRHTIDSLKKLVLYRRIRLAYLGIGSYRDYVIPSFIKRTKALYLRICTSKRY